MMAKQLGNIFRRELAAVPLDVLRWLDTWRLRTQKFGGEHYEIMQSVQIKNTL